MRRWLGMRRLTIDRHNSIGCPTDVHAQVIRNLVS